MKAQLLSWQFKVLSCWFCLEDTKWASRAALSSAIRRVLQDLTLTLSQLMRLQSFILAYVLELCVCVRAFMCGDGSATLILSSAPFQMFTNSDEAVINKKLPKELLLRWVTFQSASIRLSAGLLLFFGKRSWHDVDSTLTTIGLAPPPSLYKHQTHSTLALLQTFQPN